MLGNVYMLGTLVSSIINLFQSPTPAPPVMRNHGRPGSKYYPTMGEIWPAPMTQKKSDDYLVLVPSEFKFKVVTHTCPLLKRAIERYSKQIRSQHNRILELRRGEVIKNESEFFDEVYRRLIEDEKFKGGAKELVINLKKSCNNYPYPNMHEEYTLAISMVSTLSSESVWGILRGLESFKQSFYSTSDLTGLRVNITQIHDYPRYEHRGILLDTANHFISVPNILRTLEAMAINKMNVFHWHFTDDASFSYESAAFPKLSAKGSFGPNKVYTKAMIKRVFDFARDRGIRVIPGFSVPDHTQSWGLAYPEILSQCYTGDNPTTLGPMNPINATTFHILSELFREIRAIFPDPTIHLGGGDVDYGCWKSNYDIVRTLVRKKLYSEGEWYKYFMNMTISLLSKSVSPIVWEDAFVHMTLPRRAIIHIGKADWINEIVNIIAKGHRVLYSHNWNINGEPMNTFEEMYLIEPRINLNRDQSKYLIGGEICVWTDLINDFNIISSTWPRASAVAEVLWSKSLRIENPEVKYVPDFVKRRLEEHSCRMRHRGIYVSPAFGPDVC